MTCNEFERVLPELEAGHDLGELEQEEHLRSCPACFALWTELRSIVEKAPELQATEEPNPRVWNSIEIALRLEGLIREPVQQPVRHGLRWKPIWLIPITAVLLITSGVLLRQHEKSATTLTADNTSTVPVLSGAPGEADQLARLLATATPAVRAAYQSDLQAVNSYVHDAEESARQNPNDEVAQQYLRGAYEQRSMVYEMALNRLP